MLSASINITINHTLLVKKVMHHEHIVATHYISPTNGQHVCNFLVTAKLSVQKKVPIEQNPQAPNASVVREHCFQDPTSAGLQLLAAHPHQAVHEGPETRVERVDEFSRRSGVIGLRRRPRNARFPKCPSSSRRSGVHRRSLRIRSGEDRSCCSAC